MNSELRAKQKKMGIKRFFKSFTYSWAGLKYAYTHEQSMFVHATITILVVVLGILLKLSLTEWLFCLLIIGLVISTELINTSIEAVVDLTCPRIDPLAKIAKDTASAAVFVFALVALTGGIIIFVPKIIEYLIQLL